jgi:hypothetical protein
VKRENMKKRKDYDEKIHSGMKKIIIVEMKKRA